MLLILLFGDRPLNNWNFQNDVASATRGANANIKIITVMNLIATLIVALNI